MKASVIGIDADRQRIAVVGIVGGQKTRYTIDRLNGRGAMNDGYCKALGYLMERAVKGKAAIFLEGIFLANPNSNRRDVDTFRVLANVQGEIIYEANRHGVPVQLVPPAEWQKRVLGFARNREMLKEASRQEARKLMGDGLTEHESDAACICLYGQWVMANEKGVV
jgi:hypothetical protein